MKKILILFLVLVLSLAFVSCIRANPLPELDVPPNTPSENEEAPREDEELPKEDEQEPIKKPETVDEIIAFANTLEREFPDLIGENSDMSTFSLETILIEAQPEKSDDAGDEYQNSTAYLGDSVTLGLGVFKNHPKTLVIAKGSINPLDAVDKKLIELDDGTMVNFPDALKLAGAKRAVLTFGSNAISVMSEELFLKYYIKLIDAINETAPDCKVIIQSITPLATTSTFKKLTNDLVNRSNLLLLVLSYSRDIPFLDSSKNMKDENGYLKLEYCSSDDGVHINEQGYKIWIDVLRTHPVE